MCRRRIDVCTIRREACRGRGEELRPATARASRELRPDEGMSNTYTDTYRKHVSVSEQEEGTYVKRKSNQNISGNQVYFTACFH